ncbi:MAG: plasmid pRiA4b ORF-3 family protein [Planctomycetota bacterium]|jgi:hypothetical protein
MTKEKILHRFKITLRDIEPPIWRRIQVPSEYTFWDLHVAVQDAMGWFDCHLHAFRIADPESGEVKEIGIPDEEGWSEIPTLPGWEVPITDFFSAPGCEAEYEYDFGDGWTHEVLLEDVLPRPPRKRYPKCLDGARACPPEDCGGPWGYLDLLDALADPTNENHEDMMSWLGGSIDPEAFDPGKVRFDDPRERLDLLLE